MSASQNNSSQQADDRKMRAAERAHDEHIEFFYKLNQAAADSGTLALRMVMLINGGAAVALISFGGHLPNTQMKSLAGALLWFAWGALTAVAGIALTYFYNYAAAAAAVTKQRIYDPPFVVENAATKRWYLVANICLFPAIGAGVLSAVFFLVGAYEIRAALFN